MRIFTVVIGLLLLSCQTKPEQDQDLNSGWTDRHVARTNQMAYFNQLKAHRPDLVKVDCKNNLIAKLKYRKAILSGTIEFSRILQEEYSSAMRKGDAKWADTFRRSASVLKEKIGKITEDSDFYVANYPPDKFVGYHIGRPTGYDEDGLGRKVYIEFRSMVDDLTPEIYLAFSEALYKAGFNGDSKVQLGPGVARFQFNNIVIHAGSSTDAVIAEKVAREFFSGKLISMGRGLDVKIGQQGYNWNRFLCNHNPNQLPPAAFLYLEYRE